MEKNKKTKPLNEGLTKGNLKPTMSGERQAPPPPPAKPQKETESKK